jgi:hypothetical protein
MGSSTSHNPIGLHGLLQGELYIYTYIYIYIYKVWVVMTLCEHQRRRLLTAYMLITDVVAHCVLNINIVVWTFQAHSLHIQRNCDLWVLLKSYDVWCWWLWLPVEISMIFVLVTYKMLLSCTGDINLIIRCPSMWAMFFPLLDLKAK